MTVVEPTVQSRYAPVAFEELLLLVQKPQRYVGGERQAYNKPLTDTAVKWALAFPEAYEIGMSHLGLKILYHILNEQDGIVADRAYCPWMDMEALMRERGLKAFAHESRAALDVFDILGFSIQYELTYGNVLTMLDLAGIPLHARDRTDEHPIVLGGGPCMANPEPLADFFDAFVIGDGEEVVLDVSRVVREYRGQRRRLLVELARIPGIYVPQLYAVDYGADNKISGFRTLAAGIPERVQRIWVEDLSKVPYPTNPVVPLGEIVQDRYAIEVVRGCTQSCRFCQAGYWYRPVRERPVEQIVELARQGVAEGGFDDVSLISLSTADHSQVQDMTRGVADALKGDKVSISLPSLRADSFSVGLAEAAGEVKKNGFTFAPETGSERLRRVINKNITDAAMLDATRTAYKSGWSLIKLYFMIGIPTEDHSDIESIATLTRRINDAGREVGGGKRVTASVGSHVPKAFTPFQWEAFDGIDVLREKIRFLRHKFPRNRFMRLKWHDPEPSLLEAVYSLGDRRAGAVIEAAWRAGARFDGWGEQFDLSLYERAFEETGVDPDWYTKGRDLDDILPWDLLDASLTKKFLLRERRKAFEERLTNDCRWGDCHMCGIPDAPNDIKLSVDLPEAPGVSGKLGLDGNSIRKAGYARRIKIEPAIAPATESPIPTVPASRTDDDVAEVVDENAVFAYRVWFTVDGACRFIAHSDVMRAIQRASRVGCVPVRFSQGFTPRPKMSFGPPLPLGLSGAREVFDVELHESIDDLAARLNSALPDGLVVIRVEPIELKRPALTTGIRAAEYRVDLPAEISLDTVRTRVTEFHAAASVPFVKSRPGKKDRVIELKRAIRELAMDGSTVDFRLAVREEDGHETRAQTVLEQVLGLSREDAARTGVRRLAMFDADGVAI